MGTCLVAAFHHMSSVVMMAVQASSLNFANYSIVYGVNKSTSKKMTRVSNKFTNSVGHVNIFF